MISKRTLPFILILFLLSGLPVFAASTDTDVSSLPEGVELSLSLYEKQIYTPDSTVQLRVEVHNSSETPYSFQIADDKAFSLEITAKDLHNEKIDVTEEYLSKKHSNQQVLYRQIRLLPGETYAFRTSLSSFVTIAEPGIYFLEARLHTEISGGQTLESNELTLHIRPGKTTEQHVSVEEKQLEEEKEQILRKRNLSPDEVVRYMINARIQGNWEKYFLYLDVKSLMLEHRLKQEQYKRRTEKERQQMVEEYKELLRSSMVNNEILLRPTSFEVVRYHVNLQNREEAEVTVRARFKHQSYTEIKRFTYYLNKANTYWQVYKYDVINMGTE